MVFRAVSTFAKTVFILIAMGVFAAPLYGSDYESSDLAGTWSLGVRYIDSEYESVGYTKGSGIFGGSWSYFDKESDGGTDSGSLVISAAITSNGVVTLTPAGDPSFEGYLNASKNVIASVSLTDGDFESFLGLKKGASYSSSDLSGTWKVGSHYIDSNLNFMGYTLLSGAFGGSWSYYEYEVEKNGAVVTDSEESGNLTISGSVDADGVMTLTPAGDPSFEGYLNASKDVFVSVNDGDGDYNFIAGVKKANSYSASDLEGIWRLCAYSIGKNFDYLSCSRGSGSFGNTWSLFETENDGSTATENIAISATINSEGQVTLTPAGDDSFEAYMNASKDVMISMGDDDEDFNLIVLVKSAVSAEMTAGFTANPTSGMRPLTVAFSDASSGEVTGWSWNFGDGTTSTEQNPSHIYSRPGAYTVTLSVAGPGGEDTATRTDYIKVKGGLLSSLLLLLLDD